ncbi:hypothetical protein RsoM2USA_91 [Ralstonia phage RsoM2USA]|nr:hypothetical protein RsoM2USA_91 [Ralstonia phage RsoM2USA]
MLTCYQFKTMNILEHGKSVHDYYLDLIEHLRHGSPLKYEWRLPKWLTDYKDIILKGVYDLDIMSQYHIYHDCGKPLCVTIDEHGKQHFPNHAEVSYKRWLEYSNNETIANLIRSDMDIHLLRSDGAEEFAKRPEAISLLITGLAEIHSNAQMFGGIESDSFKIKWKRLDKLGCKILKLK